MHESFAIGHSLLLAAAASAGGDKGFDWQTPLALCVVVLAAAGLIIPVWRRRRRVESGGCASAGGGCGCSAVKKNLRAK